MVGDELDGWLWADGFAVFLTFMVFAVFVFAVGDKVDGFVAFVAFATFMVFVVFAFGLGDKVNGFVAFALVDEGDYYFWVFFVS